jgi:hypothetical protein
VRWRSAGKLSVPERQRLLGRPAKVLLGTLVLGGSTTTLAFLGTTLFMSANVRYFEVCNDGI